MPTQHDPSRSPSTQPCRTTSAAQAIAPSIRVHDVDGRTTTIYPLVDVLSPRMLRTLAAVAKKGGR